MVSIAAESATGHYEAVGSCHTGGLDVLLAVLELRINSW